MEEEEVLREVAVAGSSLGSSGRQALHVALATRAPCMRESAREVRSEARACSESQRKDGIGAARAGESGCGLVSVGGGCVRL